MPPTIQPPFNGQLDGASITRVATWRPLVTECVNQLGLANLIPVPLALGLIYAESRGNPNAVSPERSSFGLMQVNAAVHFAGRPTSDLFNPRTNVLTALPILANAIRTAQGDIPQAVSRYNGGAGRRQPAGVRFCVMWRQGSPASSRSIDVDCARAYVTKAGEFGNQPYVDEVTTAAAALALREPPRNPSPTTTPVTSNDASGSRGLGALHWSVLAVGALVAWYLSRK